MKIVNRKPEETADVSAARDSTVSEFWKLIVSAVILLVAIYLGIGLAVDLLVPLISFETEAELFSDISFTDIPRLEDAQKEKQMIAQTILNEYTKDSITPPLPYNLFVLDMDEANAFAMPGGGIGITNGLFDLIDDDIELAFVIAHELGHFKHRDHLRGLGRSIGIGITTALIFGVSDTQTFGNLANAVYERGYSQSREKKADKFAIELLYKHYGKVDGLDHLFQIFHEEAGIPGWAYMFMTHPSPESRVKTLEEYAESL